jgi:hypothetical protein
MRHPQVNLKVFGHSSFRPAQRDIVVQAAQHKDLFVLMPTGGGKSLCYQVGSCLRRSLGSKSFCLHVFGQMCVGVGLLACLLASLSVFMLTLPICCVSCC